MTVDISALAWLVRRMDVSATLKTFVAVFAVFAVLVYLREIYQFVSEVLRFESEFFDSEFVGWLIAGVAMAVISAFGPLAFIVWDWVARRPWRYLAALNGALLGAIAMAAIGGGIGFFADEIIGELEWFEAPEKIMLAALLGGLLAIMVTWLVAESKRIRVALKWLVWLIAGVILIGLAISYVEDVRLDEPGTQFEDVLTLVALLIYVTVPTWLVVRAIRHRIILSGDRPRELFLGALHRKGFWVRLAFLTGLPSSLWHAAAIKTPAFWAFLLARPMVYGGLLVLLSTTYVRFGVATQIIGGITLIIGGHALFYGAKRLATNYAWVPENPGDPRAPVLFLRSFEDDQLKFKRPWWDIVGHWIDLWSFRRNADEAMIDEIAQYGPIVALGMPGEKKIPFGALRYYSTHDDWQNIVAETAKSAQAIVISAGSTPGVRWEYELLAREKLLDKTLLLFPPVPSGGSEGNDAALATFADAVKMTNRFELAEGHQMIAMIPAANGAPTLLTARKATAASYVVAVRGYFQKCTVNQLADPLSL